MSKKLLNILLLTATFALYYLVMAPVYKGTGGPWQPDKTVQMLKQENNQYTEAVIQADSLYSQAETLKAQYSAISDDQKKTMLVMVPDSIDKVRLLSEVNSIASSVGLPFTGLTASDGSVGQNGRSSIAISFSVKTTYPKFKDLMATLEKSMRLFSVQSIAFVAPDDAGLTQYQVKLETYYLK
jgi:Tfp pilus assembly protein PilO